MRRAFIVFSILVFLVYARASVAYQNRTTVPDYRTVELDLLGGTARAEWDADQQIRFQRLMDLESKRYQLPEGGADSSRALTSSDFTKYIAAHPGDDVRMRLRDSGAFTALLDRKYVLRDTIYNPSNPAAEPLYFGGTPLDKEMLDALRAAGIEHITVSGFAPAVNFLPGTAIMVALIFFTLVAALKPVIWAPFTVMLEKRMKQLEQGNEAQRRNQMEADRFAAEKEKRYAEMAREIQALRLGGQRETAKEANAIVKAAREKEKDVKLAGLREIAADAETSREAVEKDIPALALAVADAITPGAPGRKG